MTIRCACSEQVKKISTFVEIIGADYVGAMAIANGEKVVGKCPQVALTGIILL